MSQFWSDPPHPLIAVLKCGAALLVLVIISAGPWALLATNYPSGAEAQTAPRMNAAVAESKRVFDERRQARETARQSGKSDAVTATREQVASE